MYILFLYSESFLFFESLFQAKFISKFGYFNNTLYKIIEWLKARLSQWNISHLKNDFSLLIAKWLVYQVGNRTRNATLCASDIFM